MVERDYNECENKVLLEYDAVKGSLEDDSTIICQQIGSFTQNILISFVSVVDRYLIEHAENKLIQKRLVYLVIETIQNILFHSDKLPNDTQMSYIIISQSDLGYTIHASNIVLNKNIPKLIEHIDSLLKVREDVLKKLFTKKIQVPEINEKGHGGIGLLTMVSKSGKDFNYKVSQLSDDYSLFHLELNLNYKNYKL